MSNGIGGIAATKRWLRPLASIRASFVLHDETAANYARRKPDGDASGNSRPLCRNYPKMALKTPGMQGKLDAIIESRLARK
ncbi:hypothetical protein EVC45_07050 [Paraburkholderia sp. UYCP14C]|uniref:hypothetical protein n=1 Tax=Paraburkholderia sp. UYCP14C TaxID=2511130 RepID=UPI0010212D26|nr:hypothetical protein [Paraburkholderia sp. UYCP14C]RZF30237.1 hypothetical protein EVC45_07050 [Paraburkholderia sp. UYCP14C]